MLSIPTKFQIASKQKGKKKSQNKAYHRRENVQMKTGAVGFP